MIDPCKARADDPALADAAAGWKSAYVHVPFCARRCPYCDFAIVDQSQTAVDHARYVDGVIAEIGMEDGIGELDAVNFGGGTPSLLAPAELSRIVTALDSRFGLAPGAEVSCEINPEDWSDEAADRLVEGGFTRVSIGAQSFDAAILGVLGRHHVPAHIAHAVEAARGAGFHSVGVDLIYGHPTESEATWRATVDKALDLDVDHISAYALTVEPGTALSRAIIAGEPGPDEDVQADRYEWFIAAAADVGLTRYEVSNFARPGHACRYNLATWAHGEYLGFGMAAHDHRIGERSRNHRRLDRYLEAVESGVRPRLGTEHLDASSVARDRFMVGIRLAAGVAVDAFAEAFVTSNAGKRFIDAGVVAVRGSRLVVEQPLLCDAVAREALSVSCADC